MCAKAWLFWLWAVGMFAGCNNGSSHRHSNAAIDSLYHQGRHYIRTDRLDSATACLALAENLFNEHTDTLLQGKIYADIGDLWSSNANYSKAGAYYCKAYDMYAAMGYDAWAAEMLIDSGNMASWHTGQRLDALDYYRQALLQAGTNGAVVGNVYEYMGVCYEDVAQYDSAFCYLRKSLCYPAQGWSLAARQLFLGIAFYDTGQLDSAEYYIRCALNSPNSLRQRNGCFSMLYKIACRRQIPDTINYYAAIYIAHQDSVMRLGHRLSEQLIRNTDNLYKQLQIRQQQSHMQTRNLMVIGFLCLSGLGIGLVIKSLAAKKRYARQLQRHNRRLEQSLGALSVELQHRQDADYDRRKSNIEYKIATLKQTDTLYAYLRVKKWEASKGYFNLHLDAFLSKLHDAYPVLSEQDVRLCLLVLLDIPTAAMADLLNLAPASIGRTKQRVAARLGQTSASLRRFLIEFAM